MTEKKIPLVSNTRLLGVIVDSKLSWKDHVDQVCLKVNRKIGALRRSFCQLTPTARRTFFLSVISLQPDLENAASAIVPSMAVSQKNRLLATWRRAVRCATGSGCQDNVTPLVKQLKIVSLEHRWALQVAEIVFRCKHGSAPSALKDKLSLRRINHGARTRGSNESYLPCRSSSLSGELSYSNRAPLMWNTLPCAMQQVSSRTSFKTLYLEFLTSKSQLQSSNTLDLGINHLG